MLFAFSYNLIVKNKPLAAIDIGTNTFRLLIAEVISEPKKNTHSIKEIYSDRTVTRLGEGISATGLIKKEAINRSIKTLKKYSGIILSHNVYKTSAIATGALRDARNREEFLKKAERSSGIKIKIISGEEEARLSSLGMMMDIVIHESRSVGMVDIGGGSTEFIFMNGRNPPTMFSLKLGVVYLADKYMKDDPPTEIEIKRMDEEISRKIRAVKGLKKILPKDALFIGTAGTITTISAMVQGLKSFDRGKIHNSKVSLNSVKGIFANISKKSTKERAEDYPMLESSRLDIIVPGTLILQKIMMTFGFKEVIASDKGLREGIILELSKNVGGE